MMSSFCGGAARGPSFEVHAYDSLSLGASVVTVGTFDGVHRGHQALLARVVRSARRRGVPSVVYTFDPPPKAVFGGALMLTKVEEKLRRLSHFGIDHVVVARFDKDYAARPAGDFMREIGRLNPEELWLGHDFRFGAGRKGDVALLARQVDVRLLDDFADDGGDRISSTRLRALIADGRHEDARRLHGWPENQGATL